MHIQYYGLSCLKLTTKPEGRGGEEVTIVVNPFERSDDLRPPQLGNVDLILLSRDDLAYSSRVIEKSSALILDMPGEYAVKGVQIVGLPGRDKDGLETVTVFVLETEGLRLAVSAGIADLPSQKQFDELSEIDILFLPVGGGEVLSAQKAAELVRKIEPAYVVPLHFALPSVKATKACVPLDDFCTEMGNCPSRNDSTNKVSIRQKDCEDKTNEILLLTP